MLLLAIVRGPSFFLEEIYPYHTVQNFDDIWLIFGEAGMEQQVKMSGLLQVSTFGQVVGPRQKMFLLNGLIKLIIDIGYGI
jgi:hypothetical protein